MRFPLTAAIMTTAALTLGTAAAQADASTALTNAGTVEFGPPALVMDVAVDGRVFLEQPKPGSFRQQWNKESVGNGLARYRNVATNACLIVPAPAQVDDDLKVGACNGVGARNLWSRKSIVAGNGAYMLISAQSGLVPLPNFFGDPSNVLKLHTQETASALGSFAEYLGA